ncbi:MAG: hypothetical protein QNJ30_07725 [Kiloniellales bacterium]|nr:hypothetical protein [Kiloniellales bacterium]
MDDRIDMERLLLLRKLTTAVAETLQARLGGYLATLQPLFQPQRVFGDHVRPGAGTTVKGAKQAFEELEASYLKLARSKLYNLPRSLEPPITFATGRPAFVRVEYPYEAGAAGKTKNLTAVSPLRWVLTYAGFTPARLAGLLAQGDQVHERDLKEALIHILLMTVAMRRQPDLGRLLGDLGFAVSTGTLPGLGELPLTLLSAPVGTQRAPDDLMIQISEVSGSPVFEEVVRLKDIVEMKTPLKDELLAQAREHAAALLPAAE